MTTRAQRFHGKPNSALRDHINVCGGNLGSCIKWSVVAAGLAISATQANAEYLVSVGDVLEVAEAGVPELRLWAAVKMDGNISLPHVGMLPVAGLSLQQIRANIGTALASKVFRQRTPDGREVVIVIDAEAVTATVTEYRHVYVNGDLS